MKVRVQKAKELLDAIFTREELGLIEIAILTHVEELDKIAKKEKKRLRGRRASEDVRNELFILTGSEDAETSEATPAVIHCFQPLSLQDIQDLESRQLDLEEEMVGGDAGLDPVGGEVVEAEVVEEPAPRALPPGRGAQGDEIVVMGPGERMMGISEHVEEVVEHTAECVVCACSDFNACIINPDREDRRVCAWIQVDRELGFGLCDNPQCVEHENQWRAFRGLCTTAITVPLFDVHLSWATARTIACAMAAFVDEDGEVAEHAQARVARLRTAIGERDAEEINAEIEAVEDARPVAGETAGGALVGESVEAVAAADEADTELEARRAFMDSLEELDLDDTPGIPDALLKAEIIAIYRRYQSDDGRIQTSFRPHETLSGGKTYAAPGLHDNGEPAFWYPVDFSFRLGNVEPRYAGDELVALARELLDIPAPGASDPVENPEDPALRGPNDVVIDGQKLERGQKVKWNGDLRITLEVAGITSENVALAWHGNVVAMVPLTELRWGDTAATAQARGKWFIAGMPEALLEWDREADPDDG